MAQFANKSAFMIRMSDTYDFHEDIPPGEEGCEGMTEDWTIEVRWRPIEMAPRRWNAVFDLRERVRRHHDR